MDISGYILCRRRSSENSEIGGSSKGRSVLWLDGSFVLDHYCGSDLPKLVAFAVLCCGSRSLCKCQSSLGRSSRRGDPALCDGDVAGSHGYDRCLSRMDVLACPINRL